MQDGGGLAQGRIPIQDRAAREGRMACRGREFVAAVSAVSGCCWMPARPGRRHCQGMQAC